MDCRLDGISADLTTGKTVQDGVTPASINAGTLFTG
jgi:hypothetical protein